MACKYPRCKVDSLENKRYCEKHSHREGLCARTSCNNVLTDKKTKCKSCLEYENELLKKKREKYKNQVSEHDSETEFICSKTGCGVVSKKFKTKKGEYSKLCQYHLEISRKNDQKHRDKIKEKEGCSKCGDFFEPFLTKNNQLSKKCPKCYHHYNIIYEPSRRKDEKRIELGKRLKTWVTYRAKKIAEIGVEEYRKHNAKKHREYFEKNKEKLLNNLVKNKEKIENRYKKMVREAKEKRNIDTELTLEEFSDIITNNCYYCGDITTMTVDRINSSGGYNFDNCISCCIYCNNIKAAMDLQSFMKKCKNITKFNNLEEVKDNFEYDVKQSSSVSYGSYKNRAKTKGFVFEITKEDYLSIVKNTCYICGQQNIDGHKNGIDRVENNNGYTIENCKACCSSCNYMKREYSLEKFLNQILKIYTRCYENLKNIKCQPYSCLEQTRDTLKYEEIIKIKQEKKYIRDKTILEKYDLEKVKKEVKKRREMIKKE